MKADFTRNEWMFLVSILNGVMMTDEFRHDPQYLIYEIQDAAKLTPQIVEQWDVDISAIINKASVMSASDCEQFYDDIDKWWSRIEVGNRIAELIEKKGVTVEAVAEHAGIKPETLRRVIEGRFSVHFDALAKIAEALETKVELIETK